MLAATDIQIMPDATVGFELVIFLATAAVLTLFVFRPTLRLIDRRRAFTSDAATEAAALAEEAEQLELGRRELVAMGLREAHEEYERRAAEARRKADAIVAAARAQAAEILKAGVAEVAAAGEIPAAEFEQRAKVIAAEIEQRVTGGGIS